MAEEGPIEFGKALVVDLLTIFLAVIMITIAGIITAEMIPILFVTLAVFYSVFHTLFWLAGVA